MQVCVLEQKENKNGRFFVATVSGTSTVIVLYHGCNATIIIDACFINSNNRVCLDDD